MTPYSADPMTSNSIHPITFQSTYRVQLHHAFTFRHLKNIIPYLHQLGISTIYASPVTRAIKGSQHGYDVSDPQRINPEIGTEEEWEDLLRQLEGFKMTWLQDIVPNHMAYSNGNNWLYDVLERGKASEYYNFFDIDTDLSGELIGHKIMAPFLGKTLTECLQEKELQLDFTEKGFVFRYFDQEYPIAIPSYRWICSVAAELPAPLSASLTSLEYMSHEVCADWLTARRKWMEEITGDHFPADQSSLAFIRRQVEFFNGKPFLLEELMDSQHYILTHAHLAASRINYRRFFTVNSLICLRMEDQRVFSAYHDKIRQWHQKGWLQGVRIDHIDGLAAPREYIDHLRLMLGDRSYIIAEKILAAGEPLPANWDLQGTSGYEFLAMAGQLLCDQDGLLRMKEFYHRQIAPDQLPYEDLVFENKHHYLLKNMGGELDNLVEQLMRINPDPAAPADKKKMKKALAVLMSSFPVYRLYPIEDPDSGMVHLSTHDQRILDQAFEKAAAGADETELAMIRESLHFFPFFTRLMQFTGPLAAKGIEDTSFYNYNALIAYNEVGDSPATGGLTTEAFHRQMIRRLASTPHSLNAGSTHDTKRGEDSRIRLQTLTSMPGEWIRAVTEWQQLNEAFRKPVNRAPAPSRNDEYFIYQSLLGALPPDLIISEEFKERFHGMLTKALREAKDSTSWDNPNEAYEKACHDFVGAILEENTAFLTSFIPFAWQCIQPSMDYSLAQLLLRITAPGVPDIYQGAESWELSLVDPDNRRPVDYPRREYLLTSMQQNPSSALEFARAHRKEGAQKIYTLYKALAYRNTHPEVFSLGEYIPLTVKGPCLSFIRRHNNHWLLVAIPLIRQPAGQENKGEEKDCLLHLPAGVPSEWSSVFTDTAIRATSPQTPSHASSVWPDAEALPDALENRTAINISDLFAQFPVVLLTARTTAASTFPSRSKD